MVALDTLRETALGEPILTVRGVSRGFARGSGEVRVLSDVELSLRTGEIVGLLGRSGSGKSTLLRIIAGLIKPGGGARWSIAAIPSAAPRKGSRWCFRPSLSFLG
jgi:NitT/TauT family transport system ATP-binding protein